MAFRLLYTLEKCGMVQKVGENLYQSCAAVGTVFVVPSDRFAGSRDFRLRPAVIWLSGDLKIKPNEGART